MPRRREILSLRSGKVPMSIYTDDIYEYWWRNHEFFIAKLRGGCDHGGAMTATCYLDVNML